ncbi:MAG: nicotinamidase-related amidase [Mariniblastus sp.]|jgi:nicotinamidase-related amidase
MADVSDSNLRPSNADFRSPFLMNANDSALLVIDMQQKLLPHIAGNQLVEWNVQRLLAGAKVLEVTVAGTEQYPQGLGETVASIREPLVAQSKLDVPSKTMFSCRECRTLVKSLADNGVHNLLLCGIETHVCVAQSAMDFISQGFNVYVCVDAVGARSDLDHQVALRRLENAGATLTTTEAVLFEWCEKAGSTAFKEISKLVRQAGPKYDA